MTFTVMAGFELPERALYSYTSLPTADTFADAAAPDESSPRTGLFREYATRAVDEAPKTVLPPRPVAPSSSRRKGTRGALRGWPPS